MFLKDNLIEVKDPLNVSEFIFSLCGLWPQKPAPVLFILYQSYLLLVVISHLYATVDYLNHVLLLTVNLVENIFNIMSAPTMYITRLSKNLRQITDQIRDEMKGETIYENMEEKRLYHRYNNISFKFSRYAMACQIFMITLMFFRPLIHLLIHHSHKGHDNVTHPYELPFSLHVFVDYKYDVRIYIPVYIVASGAAYVALFHIAQVSYVVTLVLHVCGRFSVLSFRIKKLPTNSSNLYRSNIKSIVEEHLNLRKLSRKINGCLYMILLCEYVSCVVRLALCLYTALLATRINPVISINFLLFSLDLFAYLFVYSYIGEKLANESQNVCDAFYSIDWPDLIDTGGRSLLICMINGQKAEYLTAGDIYTFSLFGYMDIVKFTMALVSMLQATMD